MSRLFPEQRENSIEYWNRLYEVSKGDGFVLPLRLEVNAILTDIAVATKAEELWTLKGRVMQVLSLLQLPDDAFEQLKKLAEKAEIRAKSQAQAGEGNKLTT